MYNTTKTVGNEAFCLCGLFCWTVFGMIISANQRRHWFCCTSSCCCSTVGQADNNDGDKFTDDIVLKRQQAPFTIQTIYFRSMRSSTKLSRSLRMDSCEDAAQHQQLDAQHSINANNSNRIRKHFRIAIRANEQRTDLSEDEKERDFK